MAKERRSEVDGDMYTTGTCTGCGRWGHAFSFCMYCGEDTGMYFHPDSNTEYNNPRNEPQFDSENESDEIVKNNYTNIKEENDNEKSMVKKPKFV
jgi:hypothetical protein